MAGKIRRMKDVDRLALACTFRGKWVEVVDKWGRTTRGTVVAAGTSTGFSSFDWIALSTPDHQWDTFMSLATVDSIEETDKP